MDPAIAFPLMLLPFVVVIALLLWNLNATRRSMREGEPAATSTRPVAPARAAPVIEEAPVIADTPSSDDEATVAAMRAEIEKQREELDRRSAEIAEIEARLSRRG